jgi:serine/threonine protein kinase
MMEPSMEGAESNLVPGYRLDRYELLCPIASGGMASVWLARLRGKRGFEKLFAIKTIKTELISDPRFQEMFLDEARIASRIIHPNVAQILELGEQDDILYIVMEYVDGDSLAKVNRLALKRGSPLPVGISLRIVAEMCGGLHAAHQLKDSDGESLGVVHRDVSPQNVLVTTEGSSKVIDFGLVKAKNRSAGETGQGVVKGKIRYMAPEQVASKGVDHRADVWAAGMVLYELLVGHVPYHTEDDLEIVKRLMGDDPLPPFEVALPPQIEKVLGKALVKDQRERFESCAQMKRAIEAAIHDLDLPAENEHVAEFLKETLPELAAKRAATIAKATNVSESRQAARTSIAPAPSSDPDIGFAATEVSGRARDNSDTTLPLTRRRSPSQSDAEGHISSYGASRTTSASSSLRDQLGERKRRGSLSLFVAAGVVLGAGGWILWPRTAPSANPNGPTPAASVSAPTASASSTNTAVDPWSLPSATTLELDAIDAGAGVTRPRPQGGGPRPPVLPVPSSSTPAAPTYNPAWSILTNPPEAGLPPPPPAPPSASAAPPPPAPPPEEPK